jgi:hypothetical protein
MLAWPSNSCTARRSPLDCSRCEAKLWRSMCGCTPTGTPAARPSAARPLAHLAVGQACATLADEQAPAHLAGPAHRAATSHARSAASAGRLPARCALAALATAHARWHRPSIQPAMPAARSAAAARLMTSSPRQLAHAQAAAVQQLDDAVVARRQRRALGRASASASATASSTPSALGKRLGRPWAGFMPSTGLAGTSRLAAPVLVQAAPCRQNDGDAARAQAPFTQPRGPAAACGMPAPGPAPRRRRRPVAVSSVQSRSPYMASVRGARRRSTRRCCRKARRSLSFGGDHQAAAVEPGTGLCRDHWEATPRGGSAEGASGGGHGHRGGSGPRWPSRRCAAGTRCPSRRCSASGRASRTPAGRRHRSGASRRSGIIASESTAAGSGSQPTASKPEFTPQ